MNQTFDWHKPSKASRKKLRQIIEKGLNAEYAQGLQKADLVVQRWQKGQLSEEGMICEGHNTITLSCPYLPMG